MRKPHKEHAKVYRIIYASINMSCITVAVHVHANIIKCYLCVYNIIAYIYHCLVLS